MTRPTRSAVSTLAQWRATPHLGRRTVSDMEHVFTVTLVRPSRGLPSIEVGAFVYLGPRLPEVGDTVEVSPANHADGASVRGYVSRVDASAESPIWVTALPDETTAEPVAALFAAERDRDDGRTETYAEGA